MKTYSNEIDACSSYLDCFNSDCSNCPCFPWKGNKNASLGFMTQWQFAMQKIAVQRKEQIDREKIRPINDTIFIVPVISED